MFYLLYKWERNVIIFMIHWGKKMFFSLTEHVVTFSVWQMVLDVKQPVHVHTFIYNRFHCMF